MNSTARKIVCEFEGDIETAVSALDIVDLADHEAGEPLAWKKSLPAPVVTNPNPRATS